MTTKILDATVISANIKEIKCIDFIDRCSKEYPIETSIEVFEEINNGFGKTIVNTQFNIVNVVDLRKGSEYNNLVSYMEDRYPYLHRGEISSFILGLENYELKKLKYYYVTDDQRMRKVIKKIENDDIFYNKFKFRIKNFMVTGTIGLLKKLKGKKVISDDEIEDIIKDLKNSSFYLNDELIKYLRGS